jgi:hypothetical protein
MTPQTTFAGGRNIWLGLEPSAVIERRFEPGPIQVEPAPLPDTVAPHIGGTFRTRCGVVVVVVGKTRHHQYWGYDVNDPDQKHAWQDSGTWGRYRSATPYDIVELVQACERKPQQLAATARKPRRTRNDARFEALAVGGFIECPSCEAENLQTSLIKWHLARGFKIVSRRRKFGGRGTTTSRIYLVHREPK